MIDKHLKRGFFFLCKKNDLSSFITFYVINQSAPLGNAEWIVEVFVGLDTGSSYLLWANRQIVKRMNSKPSFFSPESLLSFYTMVVWLVTQVFLLHKRCSTFVLIMYYYLDEFLWRKVIFSNPLWIMRIMEMFCLRHTGIIYYFLIQLGTYLWKPIIVQSQGYDVNVALILII